MRKAGIKVKFVTNESSRTRASLHAKLTRLGFELELEDILTPAMAMMLIIREKKLRPHLLVHPNVMEDFAGVDISDPNSVVIGDLAEHITFHNLNEAFQVRIYLHFNPTSSITSIPISGFSKLHKISDRVKIKFKKKDIDLNFNGDLSCLLITDPSFQHNLYQQVSRHTRHHPTHHIQHHTVERQQEEEMKVIPTLNGSPVLGVLSDISGVLSESSAQGDGVAIEGSPEAILR